MAHKRLTIHENIETKSLYDFDGAELIEFVRYLKSLASIHDSKYDNLKISFTGPNYEGLDALVISGDRPENDREYQRRVERLKKEKEKKSGLGRPSTPRNRLASV